MSRKTFRSCCIMQYLKYLPDDYISLHRGNDGFLKLDESCVLYQLLHTDNIKNYCFIVHDKDVLDNGDLKPSHLHIWVSFKTPTNVKVVSNLFGIDEQYVEYIKRNNTSAKLYLIHKNDINKFQYDYHDVVASFDYETFADDHNKVLINPDDIVAKICDGVIKEYNLTRFVDGVDYVKNKRKYDNAFLYRQLKLKDERGSRDMDCIYIYGNAGVGKSTYAKNLARLIDDGSCYVTSSGKNPFDDYKGQSTIVLDDVRPDSFKFDELLKILDNHIDSLVGCRYYNKSILECKLIVITSTLPFGVGEIPFCENSFESVNASLNSGFEDMKQLYRRVPVVYRMETDRVYQYNYDASTGTYKSVCSTPNMVTISRDKQKTSDFLNKLTKLMQSDKDILDIKDDPTLPF